MRRMSARSTWVSASSSGDLLGAATLTGVVERISHNVKDATVMPGDTVSFFDKRVVETLIRLDQNAPAAKLIGGKVVVVIQMAALGVLAWRHQLVHQRARMLAATAGIVFTKSLTGPAGFPGCSVPESATLHYDLMTADIVLVEPQYEAIMYNNSGFPSQRLNQAYAVMGRQRWRCGSFVA